MSFLDKGYPENMSMDEELERKHNQKKVRPVTPVIKREIMPLQVNHTKHLEGNTKNPLA